MGSEGPRDVQLGGTYLSLTASDGSYLSVIRSFDFKSHTLMPESNDPSKTEFLGGFFSTKFIVSFLKSLNGE